MNVFISLLFLGSIVKAENGLNPAKILLNELSTRETVASQFIEGMRLEFQEEVDLKNYAITVVESTTERWLKGKLVVRSVFDLTKTKLKAGQQFFLVGRDPSVVGTSDILPFSPNTNVLRLITRGKKNGVHTFDTSLNFLKVDPNKLLLVFLTYSSTHNIFHRDIWPFTQANKRVVEKQFQNYLLENILDITVLAGANAPIKCSDIDKFLEPIMSDGITAALCPSNANTLLGLSRCGTIFEGKRMNQWKPGKLTIGEYIFELIMIVFFGSDFLS